MSGFNPRVTLWSKLRGISLQELQREDPLRDSLLEVDGRPWTEAFSDWVKGEIRAFRISCHGHVMEASCCEGAVYDGRFDQWLDDVYGMSPEEEEFCIEILDWAAKVEELDMKVTKLSRKAAQWKGSCVCGKCDTELEVLEEDLVKYTFRDRDNFDIDKLVFTCLACSTPNKISKSHEDGPSSVAWGRVRQAKHGSFPAMASVECAAVITLGKD